MSFNAYIAVTGVLFLITVVSGVVLRRKGTPYGPALLGLHKVTALGLAVFSCYEFYVMFLPAGMPGAAAVISMALLVISAVVLIVTGGLLGKNREADPLQQRLHGLVTLVFTAAAVILFYLAR